MSKCPLNNFKPCDVEMCAWHVSTGSTSGCAISMLAKQRNADSEKDFFVNISMIASHLEELKNKKR